MRRGPGGALLSMAILAAALAGAGPASADQASQLRPLDLRVSGGEGQWHAENDFRLDWERPPIAGPDYPITAVGYRIRDAAGAVVGPEVRLPWDTTQIEHIHVPPLPGAYTLDLWLEGPWGARGPEASATLRFDDVRPATARPRAPAGWISASGAAVMTIEHPAGPQPLSGIRGYAVSVDRAGDAAPCAMDGRCSLAETDLRGGIGGDTISLGILPEGSSVVRTVAVSGSGMSSGEVGSAVLRVDGTRPEVTLEDVPPGWAASPVRLTAIATDALSGMIASGPSGPSTAIVIDGAVPRVDYGDESTATVAGDGIHRVSFHARDAAGNSGESSPSTALVRIDETGPAVAFPRAQDPLDPERIEATVADPLSGPAAGRGSIAVRPVGSRQAWEALPTTATGNRLVARWSSDSFRPGAYEFRATAYDAAGNVTATDRRGNGTRMVLSNPLKAPTALSAGFGPRPGSQRCSRQDGRRRCREKTIDSSEHSLTPIPYGHGASYAGRLTSARGIRLGGLPLAIVESFGAGPSPQVRTTTIETEADGSFHFRLQAGPSRRVEAVFAGTRTLSRSSGGEVPLQVLGGVRMRASAASARIGGAPVVFSGRVGALGAPIPPGGRPVELQFRLPGRDWSEFRTVQTDSRGRFRYPYSFTDDDSRGVRFQFRAFVPAQDGWPYEPAGSKPIFVTGR